MVARDAQQGAGQLAVDEPAVQILRDAEAVSRAAADSLAAALIDGYERRGRADWATTGGSAPIGIYKAFGEPPLRDSIPWQDIHTWWGDDRFVPRDHPLSNVLPFDQVLVRASALSGQSGVGLDGIDVDAHVDPGLWIPPANIHAMEMAPAIGQGRGPESVAAEYEAELRAAPLPLSESGVPAFDAILVGIGGDGHVFSVFPGSTAFASGAWVAGVPAPTHIEPHVARVSLHPEFLAAARLVLVVAHGSGKAEILRDVLGDARDTARWPIQHARRANAIWLLDEAAGANLRR
jgi:6-phosphogluconolactonase